jgi:hypothetical protein
MNFSIHKSREFFDLLSTYLSRKTVAQKSKTNSYYNICVIYFQIQK